MNLVEENVRRLQDKNANKNEIYKELEDFIEMQRKLNMKYVTMGQINEGELLGLIWLGIEKAAKSYKEAKGCGFLTWISKCITFSILSGLNKGNKNIISLDAEGMGYEKLSIADTVCDSEAYEAFLIADEKNDGKTAMEALEKLPRLEKEIIELCCIHQIPVAKAAEKFDISVNQARNLKIRGLSKLRKILE